MTSISIRDADEIDEQLNRAYSHTDDGRSAYPGESYEQGVIDAIEWLFNKDRNAPLEENEDEI